MFIIPPVIILLLSTITMLLWNWLMPAIFGLSSISLWQALGLFLLSKLLFGFGGFPRGGPRGRWREKWANMTPEQREEFKKNWRQGGWHHERCYPKSQPSGEDITSANAEGDDKQDKQ